MSDAGPIQVLPEDPLGAERLSEGRIGWLRLAPDRDYRWLVIEVEGGWTSCDDLAGVCERRAAAWPDAEFTPIRTLADDEVAVKRKDGAGAIADERARQRADLGYDAEHDLHHRVHEFVAQAGHLLGLRSVSNPWCQPQSGALWSRDDLVRAGALIAAAIDRLDAVMEEMR